MKTKLNIAAWSGHRERALEEIGLHPARQFCAIVERERALVDRNEHRFSLLVFDVSEACRDWQKIRVFANIAASRLRKTDMLGWLDANRTGILLPFTSHRGAKRVANDITSELAGKEISITYVVHTYPADNGQGKHDERQMSLAGLGGEGHSSPGGTLTAGGGPAGPAPVKDRDSLMDQAAAESDLMAIALPPFPRWKRAMDIALSLLLLIVVSPVMLAIMILIKVVSPKGSPLFKQERIGFLGNRFTCFKFRSMHIHSKDEMHQKHLQHLMHSDVPMTKLDASRDPRVIPLGGWLRASGLDELPQILNVLRGDMSLIGPRPCLQYEYESFQRWHKMRFDTMPGLTGLWQVSGKNRTTFTQMMRMDVSYAKRQSLQKDLKILLMTVPAVVKQVVELTRGQNDKTR